MACTNLRHASLNHILHVTRKAAHGSTHKRIIIDHIIDGARVDLSYADHKILNRIMVAAHDRLEGLSDRHRRRNCIHSQMRHRAMSTLAGHIDLKRIYRRHNRPRCGAQLTRRRTGFGVQRIDGFNGKALQNALLHHNLAAAAIFFGWLKDQRHCA